MSPASDLVTSINQLIVQLRTLQKQEAGEGAVDAKVDEIVALLKPVLDDNAKLFAKMPFKVLEITRYVLKNPMWVRSLPELGQDLRDFLLNIKLNGLLRALYRLDFDDTFLASRTFILDQMFEIMYPIFKVRCNQICKALKPADREDVLQNFCICLLKRLNNPQHVAKIQVLTLGLKYFDLLIRWVFSEWCDQNNKQDTLKEGLFEIVIASVQADNLEEKHEILLASCREKLDGQPNLLGLFNLLNQGCNVSEAAKELKVTGYECRKQLDVLREQIKPLLT